MEGQVVVLSPAVAPLSGDAPRRVRPRSQEAPLTLVFAALIFFFPSEVVLAGPLKSNGAPVRLVGMLAVTLLLLDLFRRRRQRAAAVSTPVVLLTLYAAQALFFYGWAALRIEDDAAGSLRTLLFTISACGIGLYTAVRVTTFATAHRVVGLLVAGCTLSAVIGILQAVGAGLKWAAIVTLPGMTLTAKTIGLGMREGMVRVFGTAGHPIEFAVVLGCCLPLAMHLALHGGSTRARRASLAAALLMSLALPFALSRGGMICIGLSVLSFLTMQSWRTRLTTAAAAVVAVSLAYVLVPSTYKAVQSLFQNTGDDPSITGRLDDYPIVDAAFNQAPWLGGAPMPPIILDNQWLAYLTKNGLVGTAFFAALFVLPVLALVATARRSRTSDPRRASLAAACVGGIIAIGFSGTVFDLMYFGQAAMLLFLLVGLTASICAKGPVIDLTAAPSEAQRARAGSTGSPSASTLPVPRGTDLGVWTSP